MATEMIQWQMRCTQEELDWIDAEREVRGMSRAAFTRAALAHYREVMPPVAPTGPSVLADALRDFDRATMDR